MGLSRSFTRDFNTRNRELEAFVKARAGRSISKRREAVERAATMPNSLPPVRRVQRDLDTSGGETR